MIALLHRTLKTGTTQINQDAVDISKKRQGDCSQWAKNMYDSNYVIWIAFKNFHLILLAPINHDFTSLPQKQNIYANYKQIKIVHPAIIKKLTTCRSHVR